MCLAIGYLQCSHGDGEVLYECAYDSMGHGQAAHIPWDAYMQAMPSAGYLGGQWPATGGALYASKHNPFILYNDIRSQPSRAAHVKP